MTVMASRASTFGGIDGCRASAYRVSSARRSSTAHMRTRSLVACLIRRSRVPAVAAQGTIEALVAVVRIATCSRGAAARMVPQVSMEWDGQLPVHPRPCGARRCDARNDPGGSTKDWRVRSRVHCGRVQRLHAIKGAGCRSNASRTGCGRPLGDGSRRPDARRATNGGAWPQDVERSRNATPVMRIRRGWRAPPWRGWKERKVNS